MLKNIQKSYKYYSLILLFLLFNTSIKAENFYTINNISVDIMSEKISTARDIATHKAIVVGFKRLLSWKLNRNDFENIENILNTVDEQKGFLKNFVSGYKIHHEKFSNFSYRAEFSIFYDLNKIKNWLSKNNIFYIEKNITDILIIPIMEFNKKKYLWDGPNLWSELWQEKLQNKYSKNFIFPNGDVDDLTYIFYDDLYKLNTDKVYNFSKRYNLNNIFIPFIKLIGKTNGIYEAEYGAHLLINRNLINFMDSKVLISSRNENINFFIKKCKNIVLEEVTKYFEQHYIVNRFNIRLYANFSDYKSWLIIQNKISNMEEILDYSVKSLTIENAIIDTHISINNESELFNIFNNSRLGLQKNFNNEYDIYVMSENNIIINNSEIIEKNTNKNQSILVIE